MTRTKFSPAAAVAAGLLFTLVGCEAKKSETPLSPSVAGPIPGVEISTPRLIEPSMGAKLKDAQQPIRLMIENSNTSGVRPLAYTFEVASDTNFSSKVFGRGSVPPGGDGKTSVADRPARDRAHVFLAGSRGGRCEQRALPHGAIRGPAQGVHLGAHADLSRQQ